MLYSGIYIIDNFAFLVIPASSCDRVLSTLHVNHNLPKSLYLENQIFSKTVQTRSSILAAQIFLR